MMNIKRLGLVLDPTNFNVDSMSYAGNPYPFVVTDNKIRVFFNRRDSENQSHVYRIDLVFTNSTFRLDKEVKLLLEPGEIGSFDDSGVSVGSLCQVGSQVIFYYMGWNLSKTVPWRNSVGVAIYDLHSDSLIKRRRAPIMDRSEEDPFTLSYPWVEKVNNEYLMLYGSNQRWDTTTFDIDHILKIARSLDGISWKPEGQIFIKDGPSANAFCRPSVIRVENYYLMAYAFRGDKYRIAFAKSKDYIHWINCGIFEPDINTPWESEEVTYPALFRMNDSIYFLYCGNSYGKTGFGVAKLNIDSKDFI